MSVYAVSDLHNSYDLFKQILDFIKSDDIVYVLGDCAGHGENSKKIVDELLHNSQFVYLRGDREQDMGDYLCDHDNEFCRIFYNLPAKHLFTNCNGNHIILTHAGYTPNGQYVWADECMNNCSHFSDKWNDNFNDFYIVHGHTTVDQLNKYLHPNRYVRKATMGPVWYAPDKNGTNHKCDIDCGSASSGYTCLLDLDTFEPIYFCRRDSICK